MAWLHLPKSPYSPEPAVDFSQVNSMAEELFAMLNGNNPPSTPSSQESQTAISTTHPSGTMPEPLTADRGVDWWMSSLRDFRALLPALSSSQKADMFQSNLFLLAIPYSPISEDGSGSLLQWLETVQASEWFADMESQTSLPQTTIPFMRFQRENPGSQNGSMPETFEVSLPARFFQTKGEIPIRSNFGGSSVDTWRMDGWLIGSRGEMASETSSHQAAGSLSAATSQKAKNLKAQSPEPDSMPAGSRKGRLSSITSQTRSSINSSNSLDDTRTEREFQESLLNSMASRQELCLMDISLVMGIERNLEPIPQHDQQQSASRLLLALVFLPKEHTGLLHLSESNQLPPPQLLRGGLSTSEHSMLFQFQTAIALPMSMVDTGGSWLESLSLVGLGESTISQLKKMNPILPMVQSFITANHSQSPADELPATTSAMDGQIPFALLTSVDHRLHSWRMYPAFSQQWTLPQGSLFDTSVLFLETWPTAGIMQDGACYRQRTWEPPISESGSGLSLYDRGMWPTPKFWDAEMGTPSTTGRPVERVTHLGTAARYWPTPNAADAIRGADTTRAQRGAGGDDLATAARMWPTPSAQEPGWVPGGSVEVVDRDGNPPSHPNQRFYDKNSGRVVQKGLSQVAMMFGDKQIEGDDIPAVQGPEAWPTPNARDWKDSGPTQGNRNSPNLGTMVHVWPTPSAQQQSGGTTGLNGGSGARRKLQETVGRETALQMSGGRLSSRWVEWLMGWPIGWTDPNTPLPRPDFLAWAVGMATNTWWTVDPATVPGSGISRVSEEKDEIRRQRLAGLGNGQVPMTAVLAFGFLTREGGE